MGILRDVLGGPVTLPFGLLVWLARQVAEAADRELLDPARIEAALLDLERRLNAGEIDEAEFERAEAALFADLRNLRAAREAGAGEAPAR
jgi:hypothetical protein